MRPAHALLTLLLLAPYGCLVPEAPSPLGSSGDGQPDPADGTRMIDRTFQMSFIGWHTPLNVGATAIRGDSGNCVVFGPEPGERVMRGTMDVTWDAQTLLAERFDVYAGELLEFVASTEAQPSPIHLDIGGIPPSLDEHHILFFAQPADPGVAVDQPFTIHLVLETTGQGDPEFGTGACSYWHRRASG